MLAEHLLGWITAENGDAVQWQSYRANALCNDPQAIARLREEPGQGATGMLALITLINVGDRSLAEFPAAIGRAELSDDISETLLVIGYGWMAAAHTTMSAKDAVTDTQWAVDSDNPALAEAGWDLRAVFQNPDAIERRAKRLSACAAGAEAGESSFDGCVNSNERFTAATTTITRRWKDAPPKEREWLTLWADQTKASAQFFLDQLVDETPSVQHAIMENALVPQGAEHPLAQNGALILLRQALDDPKRQPAAIAIDFNKDYGDGNGESEYGRNAYAADYPFALQVSFGVLASSQDAVALMQRFAAMNHPSLTTQAGIWLMRNDHGKAGRAALHFTLDDDGLPSTWVLQSVAPARFGEANKAQRALFIDVVRDGALGKWEALADDSYVSLSTDPEEFEVIRERIASVPGRVRSINGAFQPDRSPQELIANVPGFGDELQAIEWITMEVLRSKPTFVDEVSESFASQPEDIWKAFALKLAVETGRVQRAESLAKGWVDSPSPLLAELAREVLALKDGEQV